MDKDMRCGTCENWEESIVDRIGECTVEHVDRVFGHVCRIPASRAPKAPEPVPQAEACT